MELRKIELKDADNKNCILVVETEEGSELTLKQDRWHDCIHQCLTNAENGLLPILQDLLGIDFLYFSLAKKAPAKNSPFLYILSFTFDGRLKSYESKTTVKDIEVNLRSNIAEAIEALQRRLGELDAVTESKEFSRLSENLSTLYKFVALIDSIRALEEAISDNWNEIAEAKTDNQLKLFGSHD